MRVFVSSTYTDLVTHRQAVFDALRDMDLAVSAMEHFGSLPAEPTRACFDEIDRCDAFVGIYAGRYGYQPEPGGPSITELEYRYARDRNKPRLCYLAVPAPPQAENVQDQQAAERLERFKDIVRRELVCSTYTTPEVLARKVATAISRERDRQSRSAANLEGVNWSLYPPQVLSSVTTIVTSGRTDHQRDTLQTVAAALIKRYPLEDTPAAADGGDVARAAVVGRHEFFGSVIYTRRHADYIAFNAEATAILSRAQERPMHELAAVLDIAHEQPTLERFAALCREAGILGANGRLDGLFLDPRPATRERLSAPMRVSLSCTRASSYTSASAVMPAGLPVPGELTTREVKALIDGMAAAGCFVLDLDGGDPLVRADLPAIIAHANKSGVSVAVTTNAGAATREVVEELQRLQIQAFTVRLEGATSAIVDAVRGTPGAHEIAIEGIQRLRTLGVPVSLHWTVTTANAGELDGMAALVSRLDLQQLLVYPLTPGAPAAVQSELLLGPDEVEQLYTDAEAVAKRTGVTIVTPRKSVRTLFPDRCACGTTRCFVDPRGYVSPSGFTTDAAAGDSLRERTLDEIWRSSPAFETVWQQPAVAAAECPSCGYFRT